MTGFEQNDLLTTLRAKEAELAAGLGKRDGLAVQAEADLFDEIQDAIDRAVLVQNLDRSSAMLREVRGAVMRIRNGEYGRCEACGEEIGRKRIAALPWAALCVRCQEQADTESATQARLGN